MKADFKSSVKTERVFKNELLVHARLMKNSVEKNEPRNIKLSKYGGVLSFTLYSNITWKCIWSLPNTNEEQTSFSLIAIPVKQAYCPQSSNNYSTFMYIRARDDLSSHYNFIKSRNNQRQPSSNCNI